MKARQLRAAGNTWQEIATTLGVKSPATAHRYAQLAPPELAAVGDRELGIALLGFGGMRASELVSLRWTDIDFAHGRIRIGTSKTAAGVRDVDTVSNAPSRIRTCGLLLRRRSPFASKSAIFRSVEREQPFHPPPAHAPAGGDRG